MRVILIILTMAIIGAGVGLLLKQTDFSSRGGGDAVPDAEPAAGPPGEYASVSEPGESDLQQSIGRSRQTAIVLAAQKVGPAVVSISVTATRVVRASPWFPFRDQFFRDFFGERQYVEEVSNLGSGVIVSPYGYVVTNEHVVRNASEIKVTLPDGREYDAQVVEGEQEYDVAILKIEGSDLPYVILGDSDSIIIGEWAVAIGNPFGYLLSDAHPTVTVGVISALHRDIKSSESVVAVYKDMIQTDAAINPGNSGGPLVNALGEVIGINAFIITKSGGSMGMGFAIPVNRVKYMIEEVSKYGRMRRIWIGLLVQEITPLLAHSLGLERSDGVIISRVDEGSPSERSGLKRGDVIVAVNGERVRNFESARRAIFGSRVGHVLEFEVIREGHPMSFDVRVEESPSG
jgi:serine protease Do